MAFSKSKRFPVFKTPTNPPVGAYDLQRSQSCELKKKDGVFKVPDPNMSFQTPRKNCSSFSCFPFGNAKEITDLEMEVRRLINERSVLLKNLSSKENDLKKVFSRLQRTYKEKTQLESSIASLEKELKELQKGNDILKTKVNTLECTTFRRKDLQVELANARGSLVGKEHDLADLKSQLEAVTKNLNDKMVIIEKQDSELERLRSLLNDDTKKNDCPNFAASSVASDDDNDCVSEPFEAEHHLQMPDDADILDDTDGIMKALGGGGDLNSKAEGNNGLNCTSVSSTYDMQDYNILEQQNEELSSEIRRLEQLVKDSNAEITDLNSKLNHILSIEESVSKDLQSLSEKYETLEKTLVDAESEKETLQQNHEKEFKKLHHEKEILRIECNDLSKTTEFLQDEIYRHEERHKNHHNEMLTKNSVISTLRSKLDAYTKLCEVKDTQISKIIKKTEKLENMIADKTRELSNSVAKETFEQKEAEVNELLKQQIILKQEVLNSERSISEVNEQLVKLKSDRTEEAAKIGEIKKKFCELSETFASERDFLQRNINEKTSQVERLEDYVMNVAASGELKQQQMANEKHVHREAKKNLEVKIQILTDENAKLKSTSDLLEKAIGDQKLQIEEMTGRVANLTEMCNVETENNAKLENACEEKDLIIAEMNQRIENLVDEKQADQSSKDQLEENIQKLTDKNSKLICESELAKKAIDDCNTKIEQMTENIASLNETVNIESVKNLNLESVCEEKDLLIAEMNTRITDLQETQNQKEKTVVEVKTELQNKETKLKETIAQNTELELKVRTIEQMLFTKEKSMEELQKRFAEKEQMVSEIYSKLRDNEDELLEKHSVIESYSNSLLEKEHCISSLMQQMDGMQVTLNEKVEQQNAYIVDIANKNLELEKQREMMERYEVESNFLEQQLNEYEHKCKSLDAELGNLRIESERQRENVREASKVKQLYDSTQVQMTTLLKEQEEEKLHKKKLNNQVEHLKKTNGEQLRKITSLEQNLAEKETFGKQQLKLFEDENRKRSIVAQEQLAIILKLETENSRIKDENEQLKMDLERLKAYAEWYANREQEIIGEFNQMDEKYTAEKNESLKWKSLYEELAAKVEPFQEQLDMFAAEKRALLSQNSQALDEVHKVSQQYALLLGHQNQKQKIHHVLKLKEDNIHLKHAPGERTWKNESTTEEREPEDA